MSETGIKTKSDPAFCLGPTIEKTNSDLLAEIGGMGGGGMAALLSEVFEDDPDDPDDSEVAEDVDEEGVIRLLAPDGAGAIGPPTRPEDDSATSTRLPKIKVLIAQLRFC